MNFNSFQRKSFLTKYSKNHDLSNNSYGVSLVKYDVNWIKYKKLSTHIYVNLSQFFFKKK